MTVRTSVLIAVMLLAAVVSAQELGYVDTPEMPAGIEGERIEALIDFINAGDPDLVEAFFAEHCTAEFFAMAPLEMHQQVYKDFATQTGGVEFHGIRSYDPPRAGQTVIIIKDVNYGAWRAFVVHFTDDDERRMAGLRFSDARTPSDVEETAMTEDECVAEIAVFVEDLCERDLFSGTVLMARGGDVLYEHACGEASKRFHVANDMDTRFNLGSMNKMFTSTAIMQLIEEGTLSLDEPISTYVNETWLPSEMTERITIHHLLSHTSGLGSYFNEEYDMGARKRFRVVDDYKVLVAGDTLAFEPGGRFSYSNTGMLLLGVVIESVTGGSYFDHIRANIYDPAGKVIGHGGGFIGINANLDVFIESGYVAVVLANYGGAAAPVSTRIRELVGRIGRE
jgi:hypothetical protein